MSLRLLETKKKTGVEVGLHEASGLAKSNQERLLVGGDISANSPKIRS